MKSRNLKAVVGVAALTCGVGVTCAQPFVQLGNTSFETPDAGNSSLPAGWDDFNTVRFRSVGDGQSPAAVVRTGDRCIELPMGSDFAGYSSNATLDSTDAFSPRNNPGYRFGVGEAPLKVWGWFYIASDNPFASDSIGDFRGQRGGLKLEFRRTENDSVFVGREWLEIDPNDPDVATKVPGVVVTTLGARRAIHTNNQWVKFERTVEQDAALHFNPSTGDYWPLPPVNPDARVSVLVMRFGPPSNVAFSSGTIFWDDVGFEQVADVCVADFNGSGNVSVQDIFDFLAAWFSNSASADVNNSGSVSVQDIFDFLAAWFAGCA